MKKNLLGLVAIPLIAIGGLTYADDAFLQKEPVNEYIKYSYDTDDGKNIPVITVYGTGIDGKMYGVTIKATNEGTTTAGTGNESYGYYFQWGNNHGNNGTSETTLNLLPIAELPNWANKGYSGTETRFIKNANNSDDYRSELTNYNETRAIQHSLWGGSGDNETIDGVVKGYNTGTHQVTNLAGRQGPCESGYHVPSAGEWQELVKLYAKANGYDLNTKDGENAWANTISQGTEFSNDLLLPLAGYRNYIEGNVQLAGYEATYWSSSPHGGSYPNLAWDLYFDSYSSYPVNPGGGDKRVRGQSVRCFKNSYVAPTVNCPEGEEYVESKGKCIPSRAIIRDSVSGEIIQINEQEWDDLELYFLSGDGTTVKHFTIMDRNLGATEVYNGQYEQDAEKINTASFGYHYQWGNNYGFEPCINNSLKENLCDTISNAATPDLTTNIYKTIWNAYSPSKYARNTWHNISEGNWMGTPSTGDNIWGGGGDTTSSNADGTLIGDSNNDWSILSGRQGPCPENYYIPSLLDWETLKNAWGASVSNSNNGTQFASDLLLPPAGSRASYKKVSFQGSYGYYWSSSPHYSNPDRAYDTYLSSYAIVPQSSYHRSNGYSVRCARFSPNNLSFNIYANGGKKAVVAFTGEVGSGKFTALGTPTKNGGYEFDGWYTKDGTSDDNWGNKLGVGSGVVANIYARWIQPKSTVTFNTTINGGDAPQTGSIQVTNGDTIDLSLYTGTKAGWDFVGWSETSGTTGVLTSNPVITTDKTLYAVFSKDLEVTYLSGVGVASIGVDAGNCKIYNKETSCTVKTPTITLKDGYGTGIWSTGSNVVNPGSDITLTADDTYTASATPNTYTVSYNANGGIGSIASSGYTYDLSGNLAENTFTKTGYVFSGWMYNNEIYTGNQEIKNLTGINGATITMVTQWKPITYTISFSGNAADATGTAPATINAEYDSGDIAPDNTFTLTGYTFTGWNTESDGTGTGYATGDTLINLTTTSGLDVLLYAQWKVNVHKLNFVVDGTNIQSGDVAYSSGISAFLPSEPKKDCNSFAGWTSSVEGLTTTGTMPDSDVTFTANWNYTCSRSSGGGGGGSSRNTEKTTETQTGSKVDSSTKATDTEDNTQDSSAEDTEGQNQGKTYSEEFQQAYEFAYKHGITTMPTIEQANMEGPLTRIAMAKMLSYYAINVLGLKPDETRVNKFNDVSDQMDAEYNNAVILAYQLGIMGINMPKNNFRPNDLVTRGEFATALSRMLYKIADGKDKYYSTHLAKLMEEKIITNNNPDLQELRGYVMIMLMRSAK